MAQKTRPQAETLYGLPQPLQTGLFAPIIAKRNPTSADTGYPFAQPWDNKVNKTYWILLSVAGGVAVWGEVITNGGGSVLGVPNGGTGDSTLTLHGVLIGEGVNPVNVTAAGTTGQVLTATTGADPSFQNIGTGSGLTAHGVLIAEGAGAFAATAAGTTGQGLVGVTGADPVWTGSPSFSGTVTAGTGFTATTGDIVASAGNVSASGTVTGGTGVTATTGDVTASTGNFVVSASGAGLTLNPVVISGASPQTANGRTFSVTFTGVSIASGASQAFDIANTSIVGAGTIALVEWSGATAGSGLSIESQISTAGHLTITMTNATSATMVTSTADITFTGIVLN